MSGSSSANTTRGDTAAGELLTRLRGATIKPLEIARFLDGLSHLDRVDAIRACGRADQRRLYEAVKGVGAKWVRQIDRTYDVTRMRNTLREALTTEEKGPKIIVASSECMLNKQRRVKPLVAAATRRGERIVRERFGAFLVEWLGGPPIYSSVNGHPRLRMRHGHVAVDSALRDAWLRCMRAALDHPSVDAEVKDFLDRRFAEVADFLRNR